MRTLTMYMAALVSVLGIATASQAAIVIDFEIGGQQSVIALGSSSVVVDIFLTASGTTSVSGYQFAVTYDAAEVGGASALVNAPTHAGAGFWTSGGAGLNFPVGASFAAAISASNPLSGPANDITAASGKVKIGSITFHVVAAVTDLLDDISGCYNCTFATGDGPVGTGDLSTTFNGAAVNIPEPTTASLLGLGLLGLTVAGRRRKN